jgi:hypothetical protein
MYEPIPEFVTDYFIERRCRRVREREAIHQFCNEWDEPVWYEMPNSVYAAYEDAAQAERY